MFPVILPKDPRRRQKAVERILVQLSRDVKIDNYDNLDKDLFFSKLIEYYKNWPENKVIKTKWGKIYYPLQFLNAITKEEFNLKNIIWELAVSKKCRKRLNRLADIIVEFYPLENRELTDFDLLLAKLREKCDDLENIQMVWDGYLYDSQKIIKEVSELTPIAKEYFLKELKKLWRKKEEEWQLAKQLEWHFNEKSKPYNIEVYILDFARYSKNHFGIKIQIGKNVYHDEFYSLKELKEVIEEAIERVGRDIVECPFCGSRYLRSFVLDHPICSCGAEFVTETAYFNFNRNMSPEISYLWDEACKATGMKKPSRWYYEHIDEYFENIYYLGRGTSSFRTWVLKRPWVRKRERKKDSNST